MPRLQIKYVLIFVILVAFRTKGVTQSLSVDSTASSGVKNALALYNQSLTDQLHLYNGREYKDYVQAFEVGQPYFLQPAWSTGTINYDGNTYKDVSMLYNVITDEVIIRNYNAVSKIQLQKQKIKSFSFLGHSFFNILKDSLLTSNLDPGFYDVLATGGITLLAKRTKNMQTDIRQKVEYKIYSKDHFYLKKDNTYIPIRTKKTFLEQLGDKKKEMQKYMRQNKFRFRADKENVMTKVVKYYNQLTK